MLATNQTTTALATADWIVYRCDRIRRGETPRNEVRISGHATPGDAMDEANRLQRQDRSHTYVVGGS